MIDRIEDLTSQDDTRSVGFAALKELLQNAPTLANYNFAHRLLTAHTPEHVKSMKIALMGSYTVDFVVPLLRAELFLSDLDAKIYQPHFNQFRQELLSPDSGLYAFEPEVVIAGFALEDVYPELTARLPTLSLGERQAFRDEVLALVASLRQAFWRHAPTGARLLLHNFLTPYGSYERPGQGLGSLGDFVQELNAKVAAGGDIVDYAGIAAAAGLRDWTDPRIYFMARIPVAQQHWVHLARAYGRYIRAIANIDIKCIVLDLDNTLWGRVLGEDGFDGIQMGDGFPGLVFRALQQYLLGLYADGYVLAICSKNDSDDVIAVLRDHPDMVLRESHFAAIEANWNEKVDNIRRIAADIQLSTDHMLFVDDNPVEVAKVRAAFPGMRCVHLQSPPVDFLRQFATQRCFAKLVATEEDANRGRQYFEERQRRSAKLGTTSLEDFYRSLNQRMTLFVDNAAHVQRIAQLTQRTNQFNMTTLRLSEAEVAALIARTDYRLITANLADQFGDSGTVAYVQIMEGDAEWILDNWLMSCRILGRTVEQALLKQICAWAEAAGIHRIIGRYRRTKKNAPFGGFYIECGFARMAPRTDGEYEEFVLRPSEWTPPKTYVQLTASDRI